MPSRNIHLTDHFDTFVTDALQSGRYKNASEVVRAGLRLLEQQDQEDAAKIDALRQAVQEGLDDYENGKFDVMESDEDIDRFFDDFEAEIIKNDA